MQLPKQQSVEIFFSYSHKDETLREELEKHLSILRRQGFISNWHDRKITAGTEWAGTIDTHLKAAGIILLLLSSDFLASDYCYDKEMQLALTRHDSGEARVIPVVLRAVDWAGAPFGKLQALPKDAKPVVSWEDQDEAFANIAQGIRSAVSELTKSGRTGATLEVSTLLRKFALRPKKYAGKEFIADIKLDDSMFKVDERESECFDLTLGDAIKRRFFIEGSGQKVANSLFAEGQVADWLEDAKPSKYRVRIRLLYGSYSDTTGEEDMMTAHFHWDTGYKLVEVIQDTSERGESKSQ